MADLLIVGAPRSGTTWVQAVLSGHPRLVTAPETHVFTTIHAAGRHWNWPTRAPGPNTVLTREQFDAWRGALWTVTRDTLLAAKPGADRVLEKTPAHVLEFETIRQFAPGARIVHLVRDPRATVRSLLGLAPGVWGRRRPPGTVEEAVAMWLVHVRSGLEHAQPEDTRTVRYEDLLADRTAWDGLLEFLELPVGPEIGWELPDTTRSPAELSGGQARVATDEGLQPAGLAEQKGHSFHSRDVDLRPLAPFERRYVEHACAAEMRQLGYTPDGVWRPDDRARALGRRGKDLSGRLFRRLRRPR